MNKEIEISIVMPVYNSEEFLQEAIDSVLDQIDAPEYELIIINDGSTDASENIIKTYDNERIVYLTQEHLGIVDALNYGISQAKGQYIVRFDSDDIMYNNRLRIQYDYMQTHPSVDICSFGGYFGHDPYDASKLTLWGSDYEKLSHEQILNGQHIVHPAVIMRKSSLLSLPYMYENYFDKNEDKKLWITADMYNLHISTCPTPIMFYRVHDKQSTCIDGTQMDINLKRLDRAYKTKRSNNAKLTVIIPFKNEGYEIEKTVCSIRCTTKNVNIILINDASTDYYNYKFIADYWDCTYIENEKSLGVGKCRDLGVDMSTTEYFVIIDGHMRFYKDYWDTMVIALLKKYPKSILCSDTWAISRNDNHDYVKYTNEYNKNIVGYKYGAHVTFDHEGNSFTAKWSSCNSEESNDLPILPISSILGACYCSTKTWWNTIKGLHGLILWGQDEPLISIKTWLAGGKVYLIKDFVVGHIYRDIRPYECSSAEIYSNSIMINHLFTIDDDEINQLDEELRKRLGDECFNEAMKFYKEREDECEKFKYEFWHNIAIHTLDWFKTEINNKLNNKD